MKISHVRSDSALSHTVMSPILFSDTRGKTYKITEWSLESIKVPDDMPHKEMNGQLRILFQGFTISLPVLLVPGSDVSRLYFSGLDIRQEEVLRHFYTGIQSGRMSAVEDIIMSIDLPVKKVPMSQTSEDREHERQSVNRWLRATASLLFFFLIAGLVFGSLGYTLWYRSNFVETFNARVVENEIGDRSVQAWVPDPDVTKTWIGMNAEVLTNIDGDKFRYPAKITKLTDSGDADEGFLVMLETSGEANLPDSLVAGSPVDVRLDRNFLGGVREYVAALWR